MLLDGLPDCPLFCGFGLLTVALTLVFCDLLFVVYHAPWASIIYVCIWYACVVQSDSEGSVSARALYFVCNHLCLWLKLDHSL